MKFLIFIVLVTIFSFIISDPVFAQPMGDFYGKAVVTGEHFQGGIMWIAIEGEKGTVITQWDLGRTKIQASLSPIIDCEANYKICVEGTVTQSDNSATVKKGDIFNIKIDPENKKQVIEGISGFLKDVEIILDFTKIYGKTV